MVFSSVPFLFFFLPLLLLFYYLIPQKYRAIRNTTLLIASLLFYSWGEGDYVIVLLISITINHYFALALQRNNSKQALLFGIGINLFILGWYKYSGFITSNLGFGEWNTPQLPLGISFFTFQAISYLVDVSRKQANAANSILTSALYISSFPQLIAGPIVRYKDVALQLTERKESVHQFAHGVKIFIIGLSQKVLIANTVAETADTIFNTAPTTLTALEAWFGLTAYGLQIFFDFAGYSNMAIGLGHMFGFKFPKNFNTPYSAQSVTHFWRRWHMTLSEWFRDYLYIPLGGNRAGRWRNIMNLWLVFLLCGFWHGAAWTFVFWGMWHGLFLSIERLGLSKLLSNIWQPFRHVYLLLVVFLGWVLFRAETLPHALSFYKALLGLNNVAGNENLIVLKYQLFIFMVLAFVLSTSIPHSIINNAKKYIANRNGRTNVFQFVQNSSALFIVFGLLLLNISALASNSYNPFIYFRF